MAWLWTFGSVPELDPPHLYDVSLKVVEAPEPQHGPHIIDVRTKAEYDAGHIQGARNASFLPPWDFPARISPLLEGAPKTAEIYVICLSAHRSIGAYKWLAQQGYTNVKQLQGGMQEWRRCKLPEVSEHPRKQPPSQPKPAAPQAVEMTENVPSGSSHSNGKENGNGTAMGG